MNKISRNETCPCGSGKKYKKCCLRDNSETALIKSAQIKLMQSAKNGLGNNIIFTDQHDFKMSEIILEFAEDLLERAQTDKQKNTAIGTACMAWNLALLDEAERFEKLEKFCAEISNVDQQFKESVTDILLLLIERKITDYANINRFIAAYEFTDMGDHLQLDIASVIT